MFELFKLNEVFVKLFSIGEVKNEYLTFEDKTERKKIIQKINCETTK